MIDKENINEAMERKAVELETAKNRLNTISEYYKKESKKLNSIYSMSLDGISSQKNVKSLNDIINGITTRFDDPVIDIIAKIDAISKEYISITNKIEHVKELYPNKFDKFGELKNE